MTTLAKNTSDSSKILFIPSFSGLFSPYWNSNFTGTILGFT